jgi:hypothetical protein
MMPTRLLEVRFSPTAQIVRRRLLTAPGEVVAQVGDQVEANDIVARALIDGQLRSLDLARGLQASARAVSRYVRVSEGDRLTAGDLVARRGILLGRRELRSPWSGTVRGVCDGCLFLREDPREMQLHAYLPGRVVEQYPERGVAIQASGALVRGIWGGGYEGYGILAVRTETPGDELRWDSFGLCYRGTIVVGGTLRDPRVLHRASHFRLSGLVVGSIAPELMPLLAALRLPVVITEGLGGIPMAGPVFELLRQHHGRRAAICGPQGGGQSGPELVIPLPGEGPLMALVPAQAIEPGDIVRLTRPPFMGAVAQVIALPGRPQETAIGTHADGAEVRLQDGRRAFVPYVNMELFG